MNKYLFLFLIPISAFSQVLGFNEGIGITDGLDGNVAAFALTYEGPYTTGSLQKLEGGLWTDNQPRRFGAGYIAYSLGIKVNAQNFYINTFIGPSIISKTDKYLSTNFQFMHDLGIGIQEKNKSIGLNLKHISNAGIKKPNIGRNFIQLSVKFPL